MATSGALVFVASFQPDAEVAPQTPPVTREWPSGCTVNRQELDMRRQKGFSLIELLIVVAIILIIAAIAIPSLIRARISANESSAAASVRQISTAQIAYAASYASVGYAASLSNLGPGSSSCSGGPSSTNACILDNVLSSGTKS